MKSLENLLSKDTIQLEDWPTTETELDQLLLESEDCDLGIEKHESRVAAVLGRIEDQEFKQGFFVVGSENQQCLFDMGDETDETLSSSDKPQLDYSGIVREAYLEVFDGFSTDRVIADPDRNCLFVQACWKRGAQASQAFLNLSLIHI